MRISQSSGLVLVLSLILAAGASASGDSAAEGSGICEGCSSAVGMVNVTVVEPPSFTGMFLSAFDFQALAEALAGFFSAFSSAAFPS